MFVYTAKQICIESDFFIYNFITKFRALSITYRQILIRNNVRFVCKEKSYFINAKRYKCVNNNFLCYLIAFI